MRGIRWRGGLLLLLVARVSLAASDRSREEERLDPALKLVYRAQTLGTSKSRGGEPVGKERSLELVGLLRQGRADAPLSTSLLLVLQYTGEERRLKEVGFEVQAQVGTVYSGTLKPERLPDLAALPGVSFVEVSRPLRPFRQITDGVPDLPAVAGSDRTFPPLKAPSPPLSAGAGALVAIIDSGVDIRHQDFRKPDGSTRIEYLLDLSIPGDVDDDGTLDGPDDLGGTLYTKQEIDRTLRGSGPVQERDTIGHGTHALSIAAGDDPRFPGMAPGAKLLVVKGTRRAGTLDFESADLLGALSFVDRKAAELGLPYVVNLSLGTSFGPHDGRTAEEQAIDSLVGPGVPGKVVVLAAGNSANRGSMRYHHFSGTAYTGLETQYKLTIPAYQAPRQGVGNDIALLDIWYEGGDRLDIRVTAPDGVTAVEASYGDFADVATPFGQVFIGNMGGPDARNGDTEAVILLYDKSGKAPSSGEWTISVRGETVTESGVYHGWLVDGASRVGDVEPFLSAGADNNLLIARPAGAAHGIAVGSFARHNSTSRYRTRWTDVKRIARIDTSAKPEKISDFSSPGGTRDGRIKPEFTAPGEEVLGAVSRDAYPGVSPTSLYSQHPFAEAEALIVDKKPDAAFGMLQGTSFSAPVVTGLVARLLAAAPSLDATQIRNMLLNSAIADIHTGTVPNPNWGWGKAALSLASLPQDHLPTTLRIAPDSPATGVVGRQYNQVFAITGGIPPYTLGVDGALPPGLALTAGFLVTGTPSSSGRFELTLEAHDSSQPFRVTRQSMHVLIEQDLELGIVSTMLPPGEKGKIYSFSLVAEGGEPPYLWALVGGTIPQGLSLSSVGVLQGTASEFGLFNATMKVSDAMGSSVLRSLSIRVSDQLGNEWIPVGTDAEIVRQIVIDPRDGEHLYARIGYVSSSEVFESIDDGRSWKHISLNNGLPFGFATIGVDPSTSDLWGISSGVPVRYDSTLKEWIEWTDCHWYPDMPAHVSTVEFGSSGEVFLLSHKVNCPTRPDRNGSNGLLSSSDGGSSWTNRGFLQSQLGDRSLNTYDSFLSVFRDNSRYIYASNTELQGCTGVPCTVIFKDELFRSNDGGATWAQLNIDTNVVSVPHVSQHNPFDVVLSPWNPDLYISILDYYGHSSVSRSLDGGFTWRRYFLPGTPRVCAFARSASSPSIFLAGTSAGVYKSDNGGLDWRRLTLRSDLCPGGSIAIDPSDPNKFYSSGSGSRLLQTRDGGNTWSVRGLGLSSRGMSGIAINSLDASDLLTVAGVPFTSKTGGKRFIRVSAGAENSYTSLFSDRQGFPIIAAADPKFRLFFDLTQELPYRTEDGGLTWVRITPQFYDRNGILSSSRFKVHSIVSDPFDAKVLLGRFLRFLPGDDTGIWRSEDRGDSWHEVADVSPVPTNPGDAINETDIAYSPEEPGLVFALGPSGIYESRQRGDSWNLIASYPAQDGFHITYPESIEVASGHRFIYVVLYDSVGRYDRTSASWNWKSFDPFRTRFASLAIDRENPKVAYLGRLYKSFVQGGQLISANNGSGGIEKTTDGGVSWSRLPGFPTTLSVVSLVAHPTQSGIIYAATMEDGLYRTLDGGASWDRLDDFGSVADVVNIAVKDPTNPALLFVGTQGFGVQVSTDNGQRFVPRVTGLANLNVRSLAFDSGSPTILYAGTEQGLFKTTDSGTTWLPTALADGLVTDISVSTGSRPRRIRITTLDGTIAVSQDEGRSFNLFRPALGSVEFTSIESDTRGGGTRLWLTMRGGEGVAYSDDDGRSWTSARGNGLAERKVNDLLIEASSGRIWIATDGGVFTTSDSGRNWSQISAGLPSGIAVTSLSADPNTGEIFVSLSDERNGGIFRGGNVRGSWTPLSGGLTNLEIRKLTNDGGHSMDDSRRVTNFFAATSGSGLLSNEVVTSAVGSPQIRTNILRAGALAVYYSGSLEATGGTGAYSWTLGSGSLPPGLGLDPESGRIDGIPVDEGTFRFTVQVADASSRTARKELMIQVRRASSLLTVRRAGGGSGLVRSTPTGIDCGSDCQESYANGSRVRLTAIPSPGSVFGGWRGGGCSGTGSCLVSVRGLKEVTATFSRQ